MSLMNVKTKHDDIKDRIHCYKITIKYKKKKNVYNSKDRSRKDKRDKAYN